MWLVSSFHPLPPTRRLTLTQSIGSIGYNIISPHPNCTQQPYRITVNMDDVCNRGINNNIISIQTICPCCAKLRLGKKPILIYSTLTGAMKQNILHIMILAKYIQNITDSSTVNYEMMPPSEEIIFKTAVESAGYFKGLIDERKDLTFVKITGLLKLFFKRISIKRAAFFTKSCTFEQAL